MRLKKAPTSIQYLAQASKISADYYPAPFVSPSEAGGRDERTLFESMHTKYDVKAKPTRPPGKPNDRSYEAFASARNARVVEEESRSTQGSSLRVRLKEPSHLKNYFELQEKLKRRRPPHAMMTAIGDEQRRCA